MNIFIQVIRNVKASQLLLFASILTTSVQVMASEVNGKILEIIVWHDSHAVMKIESTHTNGCSTGNYYSLGLVGEPKAERMYALALAAHLSDRAVHLSTLHGRS